MIQLVKKLVYTIGIVLCCNSLHAQSLDQAKKLYNEGKYEEAKPAFEKLVKQAPSNSSYNHWYGVCCFETGDFQVAEKYLDVAVKKRIQESYRYMGELYIQSYRFEEAVEMFEEYIGLIEKKKQDATPFKERLAFAEKGLRMLDKVENVQIIDSMVVDKDSFLSTYVLSEESGSLSYYSDFFQSNKPVSSTVYMNQKGNKIYYAHETDTAYYYIFNQSKLADKWSDEKQLPMNVSSASDDNYPFVLSDGVTIYFASKGNGSIGGYDLFVTRYNTHSDTYLTPEQLGMPFNSFWNDYMMVIDEVKGLGWFVSDRHQPKENVCVYLFIPNDSKSRVETDDENTKRSRAMITSIKDSWKEGANYTDLIRLAHTEMRSGKEERQKDFEFVVNNKTTYYTLNEINSPEAKVFYEKAVETNKQIQELNKQIEELRTAYAQGNSNKRNQLQPTILQTEEQLNNLLFIPDELEKKARNAEIIYLKNKQ